MAHPHDEQLERRGSQPEPAGPVSGGVIAGAVVAAAIISVWGMLQAPESFWPAWLTGVVFWMGMSLGCLAIALLNSLTGGRWGECVGHELRAGIGALSVGLLAAVPLIFAADQVFPPAFSNAAEELNSHQLLYFQANQVLIRIAVIVLTWCLMGGWLLWAITGNRKPTGYARATSPRKAAVGLLAFWLVTTFAIFDAILSLTPHWVSSLFPITQIVGFAVSGMAMVVIVRGLSLPRENLTTVELNDTHDSANMLQAFNLVWVYLSFSQYLIIWSGDLPHEVVWYLDRRDPFTGAISVALFALHFVVPFGLLLSRPLKRKPRAVAAVAALLLVMEFVSDCWIMLPSTSAHGVWAVVLAASNFILIGGVWLLVFGLLRSRLPRIVSATTNNSGNGHGPEEEH